jgi:hypothetical protein
VKRDTTKLGGESSLGSFKMNFLVLVVQLIVMNENIYSGMTSARSNNPNEFADPNDGIRHQLIQLHSEFVQNVHMDWMWRHAKPNSKEVLEHHNFVFPRIRNILRTRRMIISLWKIASVTL